MARKKQRAWTLTTDLTVGGSCLGSPTRTSLLQRWISGISVSTSQDCPAFWICKQDKSRSCKQSREVHQTSYNTARTNSNALSLLKKNLKKNKRKELFSSKKLQTDLFYYYICKALQTDINITQPSGNLWSKTTMAEVCFQTKAVCNYSTEQVRERIN